MERFFAKYPKPHTEKDALEMIHDKYHKVMKLYEDNEPYVDCLKELNEMIEDMIECLTTMPIRLKA